MLLISEKVKPISENQHKHYTFSSRRRRPVGMGPDRGLGPWRRCASLWLRWSGTTSGFGRDESGLDETSRHGARMMLVDSSGRIEPKASPAVAAGKSADHDRRIACGSRVPAAIRWSAPAREDIAAAAAVQTDRFRARLDRISERDPRNATHSMHRRRRRTRGSRTRHRTG
jgi:hypothetical protein